MKKIILLLMMVVNAKIAKCGDSGYTYYNEITATWEYVWCAVGYQSQLVSIQTTQPQYLNSQVDERYPGFFLDPVMTLVPTTEGKVKIAESKTYNGKVGSEATVSIIKGSGEIVISRANSNESEIKIAGTYTSLKGGPEFAGRGVQVYSQLVGKRVGTYCMKLHWVFDAIFKWQWKPIEVGNPGPHPDGYIWNETTDESGKVKYNWWWANWKFIPNPSTADGTAASTQGFPVLQWGKNFYQEGRQGFKISDKKRINISVYGETGYPQLAGNDGFVLEDQSDPNNRFLLHSNNFKTDNKWKYLEQSTFTFTKPANISDAGLRQGNAGYLDPALSICHIVGGTITMEFRPKIKIIAIDNLVYTKTGFDRITYDSKGQDFPCNSPYEFLNYSYPKVIPKLLENKIHPIGFDIWK